MSEYLSEEQEKASLVGEIKTEIEKLIALSPLHEDQGNMRGRLIGSDYYFLRDTIPTSPFTEHFHWQVGTSGILMVQHWGETEYKQYSREKGEFIEKGPEVCRMAVGLIYPPHSAVEKNAVLYLCDGQKPVTILPPDGGMWDPYKKRIDRINPPIIKGSIVRESTVEDLRFFRKAITATR